MVESWNNNNAYYGYPGGYGYAPMAYCPPPRYGANPFVLIVVLFILLIIVGAAYMG